MSNSPLVAYTRLSPNRNHPRKNGIHRITPHCVVGQFTAKEILDMSLFTAYDPENGSSCNYAIGKDGSIGQGVDEGDRSWCSSSGDNDHQAVTIEVASDRTHPYAITGAAYAALLDLMTDICRRHGKTKLVWPGSRDAALAYDPADNELVLTAHRFFANKACPGDYMYDRYGQMAEEVTKRLEESDVTEERVKELIDEAVRAARPKVYTSVEECPEWARPAVRAAMDKGVLRGDQADRLHLTDDNLVSLQMLANLGLLKGGDTQ